MPSSRRKPAAEEAEREEAVSSSSAAASGRRSRGVNGLLASPPSKPAPTPDNIPPSSPLMGKRGRGAGAEEEEEEEEEEEDLETMTVAMLRDVCKEEGIDCKGMSKKAQLISAIREHRDAAEEEGSDEEEADEEAGEDAGGSDSEDEGVQKGAAAVSEKAALGAIARCTLLADDSSEDDEGGRGEEGAPQMERMIKASVGQAVGKKEVRGAKVLASGLDGVAKIGTLKHKSEGKAPSESKASQEQVARLMSKSTVGQMERHQVTLERPGVKPAKKSDVEIRAQRWFGMKSSEMDQNAKYTLALIANRDAIDPKRHYKKEARKPGKIPSLFQVGEVINSSTDYYSGRLTRKERKPNLAEEILSDDRLRPYIKGKFDALQEVSEKNGKKAMHIAANKRKAPWKRQHGGGRKGGGKRQKR